MTWLKPSNGSTFLLEWDPNSSLCPNRPLTSPHPPPPLPHSTRPQGMPGSSTAHVNCSLIMKSVTYTHQSLLTFLIAFIINCDYLTAQSVGP